MVDLLCERYLNFNEHLSSTEETERAIQIMVEICDLEPTRPAARWCMQRTPAFLIVGSNANRL